MECYLNRIFVRKSPLFKLTFVKYVYIINHRLVRINSCIFDCAAESHVRLRAYRLHDCIMYSIISNV